MSCGDVKFEWIGVDYAAGHSPLGTDGDESHGGISYQGGDIAMAAAAHLYSLSPCRSRNGDFQMNVADAFGVDAARRLGQPVPKTDEMAGPKSIPLRALRHGRQAIGFCLPSWA